MSIEVQVSIEAPREAVWPLISAIENAAETISGIEQVEVLEAPDSGLVGLKWRETRTLFGKTATEVMWITEAVENESYTARAESHGCLYLSTMRLAGDGPTCSLTMGHQTKPQTLLARLFGLPMGFLFRGMMRKLLLQDLNDIKAAAEQQQGEGQG